MSSGHVWIVGAGPGDPGLITVAGMRALEAADAVVYDALAPHELLRCAPSSAELINAGKRAGRHEMRQQETNALIVSLAQQGKRVVRLKGGDPFVFGRGGEEALACKLAGVPFTVVPGITSAIAAPAYAGIPVTHRGMASNVLVVTASDAADGGGTDWAVRRACRHAADPDGRRQPRGEYGRAHGGGQAAGDARQPACAGERAPTSRLCAAASATSPRGRLRLALGLRS